MGIAHDIRPKRNKHHDAEEVFVPKNLIPKEKNEPKQDPINPTPTKEDSAIPENDTLRGKLEDEFFETKPQTKTIPKSAQSEHKTWKIILWIILFITIIAYAAYESNRRLRRSTSSSASDSSTDKTTTYTGEIIPQDYTSSDTTTQTTESPAAQSTATATTPTESVPSATITPPVIKLLNGNGIVGAAQKAKDILEKAGYSVNTIGNAKKFTYTQTYIYYKTGREETAKAIQTTLSDYDTILQLSDAIVGTNDLVIVIGKK